MSEMRDLHADREYLKELEKDIFRPRESVEIALHAIDRAIAAEKRVEELEQALNKASDSLYWYAEQGGQMGILAASTLSELGDPA